MAMRGGILLVDKPAGWTSHDVVAKLRRALGERRVGHGGTLDPMATGLLPVFAGRATRAAEFAAGGDKEYIAVLRLGLVTDTQDTTGAVLETRPVAVSDAALAACLPRFLGEIMQVPPMYSAIKQDGKRLYELARAGREVARAPRPVTIYALEALARTGDEVTLRVVCSKGTYVRTLCHDIGQALGCGGAMAALRRTRAVGFSIDDATPLDGILAHPDPRALLLPVDTLFARHRAVMVDARGEARIRNGAATPCPGVGEGAPNKTDGVFGGARDGLVREDESTPSVSTDGFACEANSPAPLCSSGDETVRVYAEDGAFLALCTVRDGILHTVKSFFEV